MRINILIEVSGQEQEELDAVLDTFKDMGMMGSFVDDIPKFLGENGYEDLMKTIRLEEGKILIHCYPFPITNKGERTC